jgi:hypothetical protein
MGRTSQGNRQFRRRAFHTIIAIILVVCVLSPYLESAVDLNDSVFATGYDTETTVAILMLLLELVLSLTNLLASACRNLQLSAPAVIVRESCGTREFSFGIKIPELSPPLPLRI